MRRLLSLSSLLFALFLCGCRLLPDSSMSLEMEAQEAAKAELPLALGKGFACRLDSKGQGRCLGSKTSDAKAPVFWQTLRAAGSTPVLRGLVARGTMACGIGIKPPSLQNRILCWQPESSRLPDQSDIEAGLLSGKINRSIRSLALESHRVCALLGDGQVACAGFGGSGNTLKTTYLKNIRSIRSLRSGDQFSCALRSEPAAVLCWGDNGSGQLGVSGPRREAQEALPVTGFSGPTLALDTGSQHACAINEAGEVFCWGHNAEQQLGTDSAEQPDSSSPQIVRGLPEKAEALALGEKHSCAQLVGGTVWCWGAAGLLGSETAAGLIPVKVPLPMPAMQIVASAERSCARLSNAAIYCWSSEPSLFPELRLY